MKHISSVTTISPEGLRSKTGMPLGEHGLATPESLEIAAFLARHAPTDMDKAAVSRAQSHGVGLQVVTEGRYPSGPNGERLPAYTVAVGCKIRGTTEQREAALADLLKFQTPAPAPAIEDWLAELSVITAGRGEDGLNAELLVTAYSSRLSKYPADVVRYALLDRPWKWFPSWDELRKVCDSKASSRRHMIAALSQPEPDREPRRRPATDEEKSRVNALVAEMFPGKSERERKAAVEIAMQGNCMEVSE